jgi:histidine triad (HIT) family protein
MEECVFCKIINKELNADVLYEDKFVIAFLDINPIAKGHCLVVPKKHFENLDEIDDNYLKKIITKVKKIGKILEKATEKEGFNLILNNKKAAGQFVNHLHFHIIPRSLGDNVNLESSKYIYKEKEKEEIIKNFKYFKRSKNY